MIYIKRIVRNLYIKLIEFKKIYKLIIISFVLFQDWETPSIVEWCWFHCKFGSRVYIAYEIIQKCLHMFYILSASMQGISSVRFFCRMSLMSWVFF